MHTVDAPSQAPVGSAFARLNPPVCSHRAADPGQVPPILPPHPIATEFIDVWLLDRSPYVDQVEMMNAAESQARARNAPVDVRRVEIPLATFRHAATIMPKIPPKESEYSAMWQAPDREAVIACAVAADHLDDVFDQVQPSEAADWWEHDMFPPDGAPEWAFVGSDSADISLQPCPVSSLSALKIRLTKDLRIPFHGRPQGQHFYEAVALALEAEAEQLQAFASKARELAELRADKAA